MIESSAENDTASCVCMCASDVCVHRNATILLCELFSCVVHKSVSMHRNFHMNFVHSWCGLKLSAAY